MRRSPFRILRRAGNTQTTHDFVRTTKSRFSAQPLFNNVMKKLNIYNNIKTVENNVAAPPVVVALAGNPNSGKTTLFNALTGSDQQVGNWPGVTVERKTGICRKAPQLHIVDTPGCYSLQPFTPEEKISAQYLREGKPDVILNVVDSTNLERNLFLTAQLKELNIPLVVALNMQDEAKAKGIAVDGAALEKIFRCAFVPVSAAKNDGMDKLTKACLKAAKSKQEPLAAQNESTADKYALIEKAVKLAVRSPKTDASTLTDKIDKIVLNKWLAFPIFALVMTAVFFLSVGGVGGGLTDLIENKLTPLLQLAAESALSHTKIPWLTSLVCDGMIGGVMSVVSFVPQITILFGCIALLEGCGYMSRIAFITDKLLHSLGLGGRSFVCMILGCGCSVPAILSTRTIKNARERDVTITLTPFVPCSAKLAVIAFFTTYAFDGNALFAVSFYFASIAAIIVGGLLLKLFVREKGGDVFLMELPPYRMPRARNVLRQMWQRCKAFLVKAGTIILAASVVLWTLTNFDVRFAPANVENSMLARLGKLISPLFAPLGFNDRGCGWQLAVATLSGIAAKETVVTTLQILLPSGIADAVSPLGAYSFVLYNLLTVPCVAACSASFAEQGSRKKGVLSAAFQIAVAYALSLLVYRLGSLFLPR